MARLAMLIAGVGVGVLSAASWGASQAQDLPQAEAAPAAPQATPPPPAPATRYHQFCDHTDFRKAHAYVSERGQQGFELVSTTAVGGRNQVLICFKRQL